MSDNNPSTNKAINHALRLLDAFANEGLSMNVSEIARYMGVTRVTAQSIVNSLSQTNYIEKNEETGKYSLGYSMFVNGSKYIYQYPFLHAAQKHVSVYSAKHSLKVNISVTKPDGQQLILLSKDTSLIPHMVAGVSIPCHVSSGGKILLAFMPADKREAILKDYNYKQVTPYSVTEPDEFRKLLDKAHENGYATELEELSLYRGCIGAPIFDITGTAIAAVSFSCDSSRLRNEFDILSQDIVFLAKLISRELGYQGE